MDGLLHRFLCRHGRGDSRLCGLCGSHLARWFDARPSPLSAVVFVAGESFVFYGGYLGITAAFTQQVAFGGQPALLLVPLAFALAAAVQVIRKRPTA